MSFEITNRGDFLYIRFFGVLLAQDLVCLAQKLELVEDPAPVSTNWVTDLTSVQSFEISSGSISDFAHQLNGKAFHHTVKSAYIAQRSIEFGIARMFQGMNGHPQVMVHLVRNLQEALDWFGERAADPAFIDEHNLALQPKVMSSMNPQ